MCALAHWIERDGVPTVVVGLVPQHVQRMRPPRALLVPFELGRPFGVPDDRAFQTRVVEAALALAPDPEVPVTAWLDEPAPAVGFEEGEGWVCPVTFAPAAADDDLAAAVAEEIARLRPWHDRAVAARGRTGIGASGIEVEEIPVYLAAFLASAASGGELPAGRGGASRGETFKLAVEDLKLFYFEAVTAQPGASSRDVADWFWRTTAGRLIRALAEQLARADDETVRLHARFTLVPAQLH